MHGSCVELPSARLSNESWISNVVVDVPKIARLIKAHHALVTMFYKKTTILA
jgi:hypothetical protein